jgi:YVTN family beta-propeller protein
MRLCIYKENHVTAGLIATLIAGLVTTAPAANMPGEWMQVAHHQLGGDGGWDLMAIDAATRRLFIARDTRVMVVDLDKGTLIGEIAGLTRAHGVALAPKRHRGFATSGGSDEVVVFDLDSLAIVDRVPAQGTNPDAIAYDDASGRAFVFNGRSNDASVLDAATDKMVAKVALPGKPELAVGDGHGTLFVNLEDKAHVARIDARTAKVTADWALGSCEEPTGLAFDSAHRRLFSVCSNHEMAIVDSANGHLVGKAPIGDGPDGAVFDPKSSNVFSSNSDGTMTVVHEDDPARFRVVATVPTPARSRTIVLDPDVGHVVLATAEFGATPPADAEHPHPRPPMAAGTFGIVEIGRR